MPSCPSCLGKAHPEELRQVGDHLACDRCRKPKLVQGPEDKMNEAHCVTEQKPDGTKLIDLQVLEVGADHKISLTVKFGGAYLNYSATLDSIREFFTRRRAKAGAR